MSLRADRLNFPFIFHVKPFPFSERLKDFSEFGEAIEASSISVLPQRFDEYEQRPNTLATPRLSNSICRSTYVQDRVEAVRMPNFSTVESNPRWKEDPPEGGT